MNGDIPLPTLALTLGNGKLGSRVDLESFRADSVFAFLFDTSLLNGLLAFELLEEKSESPNVTSSPNVDSFGSFFGFGL